MTSSTYGSSMKLPPGFRFMPTDEQLILHFLYPKASLLPNSHHQNIDIPDLIHPSFHHHLYDPSQLCGMGLQSENKWYFFSQVKMDHHDHDRVTRNGYWKQLFDSEEPIFSCTNAEKIGFKKYFAYYVGEAPSGIPTNWIMQEYQLYNSGLINKRSYKRKSNPISIHIPVHDKEANHWFPLIVRLRDGIAEV